MTGAPDVFRMRPRSMRDSCCLMGVFLHTVGCARVAVVATAELAAAVSMNATTDLDLGYDKVYPDYLPAAVKDGA